MATSDLQRLFWRTAKASITPQEDFTSEVLAIAIRRDPRPLLAALRDADWKDESGHLSDVADIVAVDARTQVELQSAEDLDPGRLDLVVDFKDAADKIACTLWIEVKIDARLNPHSPRDGQLDTHNCQLDVYLTHRRKAEDPVPAIITLGKTAPLDALAHPKITGITWEALVAAIDAESASVTQPNLDRWWTDLADFLRNDNIVPHRLPAGVDPIELGPYLPVYTAVNEAIKALWINPPRPLHWRGLEKAVLSGARAFTGGPMTWGMRYVASSWEWWVEIANRGYPGVSVPVEAVRAAARTGGLSATWTPLDDQVGKAVRVFEKSRALVSGETASEAIEWITEAMTELRDAAMLETHFREVRRRDEATALRKASSAPKY